MARPKVRLYLQAMRQQLPYKARPQIYAKAFRNNSRFSKIWSIRRVFIFSTKKSGLVYRIGTSSLPPAISLPRPQARQYTDSLPCWTQPQARSTVPCGKRRVKKRDLPHLGQISSAQPLFPCSAIKGPNLWVMGVVTRPSLLTSQSLACATTPRTQLLCRSCRAATHLLIVMENLKTVSYASFWHLYHCFYFGAGHLCVSVPM